MKNSQKGRKTLNKQTNKKINASNDDKVSWWTQSSIRYKSHLVVSYFVLPTDYGDRCLKHEHRGSGVAGVGPAAHDVPDVVPVHHTVGSDVAHI